MPARFGVVGIINTAVGLAIIQIGRTWLGLGEVLANAVGYACGLALSFLLNRGWTFEHTGSAAPAALRFGITVLLAWLTNIALVVVLLRLGITGAVAQVCGVVPYTVVTYLGCRWWVFGGADPNTNDE